MENEQLSSRVRQIRRETFGDGGISALSLALRIPAGTWEHYENAVAIPALVILRFVDITGVEPHWLLTGWGERYRIHPSKPTLRNP